MEVIGRELDRLLQEETIEIRGDGRAGSGLQLTMQTIAATAVANRQLHVQEWPFFSSARKGAPTRGYLRLSRRPILKSSDITSPHVVVLMDEGVSRFVDFAEGVSENGLFVVNTPLDPERVAKKYRLNGWVITIDGDGISEKYLKKPMGNISVFAVFSTIISALNPQKSRDMLKMLLEKRHIPKSLVQANLDLFDASSGSFKVKKCQFKGENDHKPIHFDNYGDLAPGAQSRLRLSRANMTAAYAPSGFILKFDDPKDSCNGCALCVMNCPENIIQFKADAKQGLKVLGADVSSYCKLCAECIEICPKELFREVERAEEAREEGVS